VFYVQRGQIPHKRHTQFRKPDGALYAEELFGVEGFAGRESLLYHNTPPTQTHRIEKVRDVLLEQSPDEASGPHRHRLVNTARLEPAGNAISGRLPLFYNADVTFGVVRPAEPMEHFYRNGEADEMYFVHTGHGTLETVFGPIEYGPGDYLVIPIGTTYRLQPSDGDQRMLWVECPSNIEPPRRDMKLPAT
jgi:homogentisate 1,2-dioxygenase